MQILKIIALLIEYPDELLWENRDEALSLVEQDAPMLLPFAQQHLSAPLLDKQAEWCEVLERGRATSLLLFEHVHAESRDRGQAMVNLLEVYHQHGFELSARELPDYIPLFLEYLAQRPVDEALSLLTDAMPVIALIGARLAERGSDYHVVFDALAALVGEPASIAEIRRQAATEGPDQTVVNMDQIWEEEAVTFLANQEGCDINCPMPGVAQPVQWVPPPDSTRQSDRSL